MEDFGVRLILRAGEVCELLGWSEAQLYMAVRRGQVPARQLGRRVIFLRTELEAHFAHLPHVAEETVVGGVESLPGCSFEEAMRNKER